MMYTICWSKSMNFKIFNFGVVPFSVVLPHYFVTHGWLNEWLNAPLGVIAIVKCSQLSQSTTIQMSTPFVKRGQLPLLPEFTQGITSYSNSMIEPTVKFYWNLNFAVQSSTKYKHQVKHGILSRGKICNILVLCQHMKQNSSITEF